MTYHFRIRCWYYSNNSLIGGFGRLERTTKPLQAIVEGIKQDAIKTMQRDKNITRSLIQVFDKDNDEVLHEEEIKETYEQRSLFDGFI